MEAGETFPYIVNLTPKGAACVIESLAAKCADETDELISLRHEKDSYFRRTIELESRVTKLERSIDKEVK